MDVEWGYSGDRGPENWVNLCDWFARGAEFPLQSPIHLTKGEEIKTKGDTLSFHYQKQRFTDKEFKNTIHLVPFDQLSYVEFKKERYYLTDIHFHLPSEHIIDGNQEDIEFHFVHMNNKKENMVVGVMYQLMEQEGWFYNHYVGSLTTPPTSGPIQWFVMDHVGKLNQEFLLPFKGQYAQPNNRPIQPLNGREIYYFEEFEE